MRNKSGKSFKVTLFWQRRIQKCSGEVSEGNCLERALKALRALVPEGSAWEEFEILKISEISGKTMKNYKKV